MKFCHKNKQALPAQEATLSAFIEENILDNSMPPLIINEAEFDTENDRLSKIANKRTGLPGNLFIKNDRFKARDISINADGSTYRGASGGKIFATINKVLFDALDSIKALKELKETVPVIKQGVQELFESNKELANIGTLEQYSNYLNTIFPDSKVKNIVYHKTPFNFDRFETPIEERKLNKENKSDAIFFNFVNKGFFRSKEGAKSIAAIVNISNNIITDENIPYATGSKEDIKDILKRDFDSIIVNKQNDNKELLVFKPEQTHILGSKQDIQGFKEFVFNKENSEKQNKNNPVTENKQLSLFEDTENFTALDINNVVLLPSGKVSIEGVEFPFKDVNTELLEDIGYSIEDIGRILKKIC